MYCKHLLDLQKTLKAKYNDIEVGFDYEPEPGLADNGDLEHDLLALVEVIGIAAKNVNTAFVIFIDELQYVEQDELATLITVLHIRSLSITQAQTILFAIHPQVGSEKPRLPLLRFGHR